MAFRPRVNDTVLVDGVFYRFTEHPSAKGMPFGQTGRRATVYQLQGTDGSLKALKVFNLAFRTARVAEGAERIRQYSSLAGLEVCTRQVITPIKHASLISQYPDLSYAVLMPWVNGQTWQDIVLSGFPLLPDQSFFLASALAQLLFSMENQGIAHTDLSGPNIMLPGWDAIEGRKSGVYPVALVDVEDLFAPDAIQPEKLPAGSSGYSHLTTPQGIWSADADRFSGAIILAEMLAWCDQSVRQISYGEQYFNPDEMQAIGDRYQVVLNVLKQRWGERVAALFQRAWFSKSMGECPTFREWLLTLQGKEDAAPLPVAIEEAAKAAPQAQKTVSAVSVLDELRSRVYACAGRQEWSEVVGLCEQVLAQAPDQADLRPLLVKGRRIIQLEQELNQQWETALQSGIGADWERCWQTAQAILQQSPAMTKYAEIAQQAEQEITFASLTDRAAGLVSEKRWNEAENLLANIPSDHPYGARVRAQIGIEKSRTRRVADLAQKAHLDFERSAWDDVVVACQTGLALGGAVEDFQPLLDKAYKERELDQQVNQDIQAADQALLRGNLLEALICLDRVLAVRPGRRDAQEKHARVIQQQGWADQIVAARRALDEYKANEALMLLSDLPADYPQAAELGVEARKQIDWVQQMELARQEYDLERLSRILTDAPVEIPERNVFQTWLVEEQKRKIAISGAQDAFDGDRMLAALADAPADYPNLEASRRWANGERFRRQQIIEAKAAFDGDRILTLLDEVPDNYPQVTELRQWAQQEVDRAEKLQMFESQGDASEVLALLSDVPENYPNREDMLAWAGDEQKRLELLQKAKAGYDADTVFKVLQDAPANFPKRAEWQQWAQHEVELRQEIAVARQSFDGGVVLALLMDVPPDYPEVNNLRNWGNAEAERRRAILAAEAVQDWAGLAVLYEQAPADYPGREEKLVTYQAYAEDAEKLQALQKQVEQAVAQGDWPQVVSLSDEAVKIGSNGPFKLEYFRAQRGYAAHEIEVSNRVTALMEDAGSAIEQNDLDSAVRALEMVLTLRPADEDMQEYVQTIRQRRDRKAFFDNIQRMMATGNFEQALGSLQNIPVEDDEANALRQQAQAGLVQQLSAAADQHEKQGNWKAVVADLQRLMGLGVENAPRLQHAQREFAVAAALFQAQGELKAHHWQKAIEYGESGQKTFPDKPTFAIIISQAKKAIAAARNRLIVALGITGVLLLIGFFIVLGMTTGAGPAGPVFWTKTHTPTASNTATITLTPSITPTPSSTFTSTPTFTITPTFTQTFTPSATFTITPTPSDTPTITPTLPPTLTPTFTPTTPPTNTPVPPTNTKPPTATKTNAPPPKP